MLRETIVETFLELHDEEHAITKAPETCPICDILVRETKDIFEDQLSVGVLDVVTETMNRWNQRQYFIGANSTPEILASAIVGKILDYPIVPKTIDVQLDPSEIWNHPYVLQKIKELSK